MSEITCAPKEALVLDLKDFISRSHHRLVKFHFPEGLEVKARWDIPFEIRLAARLSLDEIVFNWNKANLEEQLNQAIDSEDKRAFNHIVKTYKLYI